MAEKKPDKAYPSQLTRSRKSRISWRPDPGTFESEAFKTSEDAFQVPRLFP